MATRWQLSTFTLCLILAAPFCTAHADIYRWDNGAVIPGTEGIEPGPGVQLDHMNLEYAGLSATSLTGANFQESNLANARMGFSPLEGANLAGALVSGASFVRRVFGLGASIGGITLEQLVSTASYRAKDLHGIGLPSHDLVGSDLSGQNLTGAILHGSDLANADLSWANLTNARLPYSTLTNADLTGANLKNAYLDEATGLTLAKFSPESVYNQWTVCPADFSPAAAGLTMAMSPKGDLDANDTLDAVDIDMLASKIRGGSLQPWWLPDAAFDMDGDSVVNQDDHHLWVKNLEQTWFGDADLDGEFDSNDFVQVFQAGTYETESEASWSEGDWNGDGTFDSDDFVTAFQDGGYEQGPRPDAAAVPEPTGVVLLILGLVGVMRRKTTAQNRV